MYQRTNNQHANSLQRNLRDRIPHHRTHSILHRIRIPLQRVNRRNRDRILRFVAPIARLQPLLHPQFRLQRLQKQILRRFLRDLQLAARVQLLLPRLLRLPVLVELRFLLLQRFVDRHRSLELQIELGRLHLQQ